MTRLVRSAIIACALFVWSESARADTYDPKSAPERGPAFVELGAAVFARYDHGDFCTVDGDAVSCSSARGFVGGALVPRLRLWAGLSVGLLGAYGFSPSSEGTASSDGSYQEHSISSYRLEAEARFHPLYKQGIHLWLGFDTGVTAHHDTWRSYDVNDRETGMDTSTDVGAVAGVGVGIDLHVLPFLALGPELHGAIMRYPDSGDTTALNQHERGGDFFVSVGVAGTLLVRP